jgi:hypothetical protein
VAVLSRERMTILVTVKAYPVLSDQHGESICVAGVRVDSERPAWIRLFPVPFRDLPAEQRFKKYQFVTLSASRTTADQRPESYRPDANSLVLGELIDTDKGLWRRRMDYLRPLEVGSMCEVVRRQQIDGTSLAMFRPGQVLALTAEHAKPRGASQSGIADQMSLLGDPSREALEQLPFKFRYRYRCSAEPGCPTHHQSILDWELGQAYRSWRDQYGEEGIGERMRQKWLDEIANPRNDTRLYVGSIAKYPTTFCVLGTVYPRRETELLF